MFYKIDIKDYESKLNEKKYDEIFDDLSEKSIKLSSEILKIKDYEISKEKTIESMFMEIKVIIERYFGVFRTVSFFMDYLINWDDDFFETSKEKTTELIVDYYNLLVDTFHRYKEKEIEIKEKGFELMCDECTEKLKKLYIEMLRFKNKNCNEKESLRDLTKKVAHYYNFLEEDLYNAESALYGAFIVVDVEMPEITLNETERIVIAEGLINELTPSENDDGYKAYADYYQDYDLKEGQTYSDLYDEKENLLIKLLIEMLEFIGIEVSKEKCNLSDLRYLVSEHYPFYEGSLSLLRWGNPNETYISRFDTMDKVYERLANDYKNYEQNMAEYKIFKEEQAKYDEEFDALIDEDFQ